MPLQVRRGTDAERLAMTQPLAAGELVYVTNDQKLYVGDGATLGGIQITGYTDNDAKDSAAEIFTDGVHSGIGFAYNTATNVITATVDLSDYAGTIRADAFKGSVFADDGSTVGGQPLVDAISGTFNGNLSGNVTGNLLGNVTGNITGNVLTAAQPNITSVGTLTSLAVAGGVTGTSFTGDIVTSLISSADSSAILVDTPTTFQTNIIVEDNLRVNGTAIFNDTAIYRTDESEARVLTISQHHASAITGSSLTFRRSRGTSVFELDAQSGDILSSINSNTKVTDGYVTSTAIVSRADGTLTSTAAPGKIEFFVARADGVLVQRMSIDRTGLLEVRGSAEFTTESYSNTDPFVSFAQHHDHNTTDARNITFARARGTLLNPVAVNNNDDIIDITFTAFDGVQFVTPCAITVVVDAAPNTGNGVNSTPGRMEFLTNNGTNLAARVRIDSNGTLEALSNLAVTGLVDFITVAQTTVGAAGAASALPATPSTYFKIKVNGTEYVVPAYAVS
jgi:hypothetical protein